MQITELTGQVETHLTQSNTGILLHKQVLSPFTGLQAAAKKAGFNLKIASGFRNFDRQCLIWNNKYSGKRILLDENESPLTYDSLTEQQRLHAILHWSALPGASRHHWGTDFDIYDPDLLPHDKKLQLTCSEYQQAGYFFELSQWLSENMEKFDFYRPYQKKRGGVAIEPWHISFYPISNQCLQKLSMDTLHKLIMEKNVLGKSLICQQLPMIYEQYILNINEYGI